MEKPWDCDCGEGGVDLLVTQPQPGHLKVALFSTFGCSNTHLSIHSTFGCCSNSPELAGLSPQQSRWPECWQCLHLCCTPPPLRPAPRSPWVGLRWEETGVAKMIEGGFLADRWMGWQPHTIASHQCSLLKPNVLSYLKTNVHATVAVVLHLLFNSHCTSMSTSLPMLSPMVFVARQVYVPASYLHLDSFSLVIELARNALQNHHCGQLSFETKDSLIIVNCHNAWTQSRVLTAFPAPLPLA